MDAATTRATVYLEANLHQALRIKAATSHRSISDIVNEAVRSALREDQEDLTAIDARSAEPSLSYEQLLEKLKADGTL